MAQNHYGNPTSWIAHLRDWHARYAERIRNESLSMSGPHFEAAAWGRWKDVGVLLRRIDELNAALERAPTSELPVPGGPCEPHYLKGWNDAIRLSTPVVRTVFNRGRIDGKDTHLIERMVIDAMRVMRRASTPVKDPPTTITDVWDGSI